MPTIDRSIIKRRQQINERKAQCENKSFELKSTSSSSLPPMYFNRENRKSSKKEKHLKGIEAAVPIIVEISWHDKKFQDFQMNTVLASMLSGTIVTANSPEGERALMKATQKDIDLVRVAIDTSKKTKEFGGDREDMTNAATSVLACRSLDEPSEGSFESQNTKVEVWDEDEDLSSLRELISTEKKEAFKEKNCVKGIDAAASIATTIALRDKKITFEEISAVLASIFSGEITDENSRKGGKL